MAFEIFEVAAGAGRLAIAPLPGLDGDLARDVEAIVRWGADGVVSLTETKENKSLGAEPLHTALRAQGVLVYHLAIRDFDVPDGTAAPAWAALQAQVAAGLQGGGRVLVHCRGGCGRSGMVALKLLVALGEAPEAALARLRAVRPCAVETDAQMIWATEGAIQKT